MFISYAQNFEDVILWRALKFVENGFYIDIGAQDPFIDSVSRGFYERGWRGIHVEPTATYAQKLRENRPDEVVCQVAIGKGDESIRFFEIPETGLSTGSAEIAQEHQEGGFVVRETEVPLIALSKLLENASGRDVHWLKIDVEGMERSVIESWLPSSVRPWLLVVESTRPLREETNHEVWEPLLISLGYEFVYFDGLNRFYVHNQHLDLRKHFEVPPNVFDEFSISGAASSKIASLLNLKIDKLQSDLKSLTGDILSERQNNDIMRDNIARLVDANSKLDQEKKARALDLEAMEGRLIAIESKYSNSVTLCKQLECEIANMKSSLSWKITSPIRVVKKMFTSFERG